MEAQISFIGVPLRGGRVRMLVVLRALTIIDCQKSMVKRKQISNIKKTTNAITQESQIQNARQISTPTETKMMPLKRKVGYGEDVELAKARHKFQTMQVDNDHPQ